MKKFSARFFYWASCLLVLGAILVSLGHKYLRSAPSGEPTRDEVVPQRSGDSVVAETGVDKSSKNHTQVDVPENLLIVIGQESANYDQRIVALKEFIHSELGDSSKAVLLDYIRGTKHQPAHGRSDLVEAAIKNDLIEWLRQLDPAPLWLTETLVAIVQDEEQPFVMRDYALQHLGSWAERLSLDPATASNEARRESMETLWWGTAQTEHSIAGTALLGLRRIATVGSMDFDRLRDTSEHIAASSEYSDLSRATSLHVLADLDPTAAITLSTETLTRDEAPLIQLAAIGVFADHAQDLNVIESITAIEDGRFDSVIKRAKERIAERRHNKG